MNEVAPPLPPLAHGVGRTGELLAFRGAAIRQGLVPPSETCEITFGLAEQMVMNSDALGLLTYLDRKLPTIPDRLKELDVDHRKQAGNRADFSEASNR